MPESPVSRARFHSIASATIGIADAVSISVQAAVVNGSKCPGIKVSRYHSTTLIDL
jgi:hypothetical protein